MDLVPNELTDVTKSDEKNESNDNNGEEYETDYGIGSIYEPNRGEEIWNADKLVEYDGKHLISIEVPELNYIDAGSMTSSPNPRPRRQSSVANVIEAIYGDLTSLIHIISLPRN